MKVFDDELKDKKICSNCVDEPFLRQEIETKGKKLVCDYCKSRGKSFRLIEMAERIEKAFKNHYVFSPDEPTGYQRAMQADKESDYFWLPEGEQVIDAIRYAAEIPEEAAIDIQEILDEKYGYHDHDGIGEQTEFGTDTYYQEKSINDESWQIEWQKFENILKTEARFFSTECANHLESVFENIDTITTRNGRALIITAGPNKKINSLYRARVFQSDDRLKSALARPDLELGTPPSIFAVSGRMNARGISVFYGATDSEVAISEVRPPVGSKVAVARFDIIKSLKLFDLSALGEVSFKGSIFDDSYVLRLERAMFLRSLSQRISQPVMPVHEEFEYLATQAIADFLA